MLPAAPLGYENRMPRFKEATELGSIGPDVFGRETQLAVDAANAWTRMRLAAETAGIAYS